MPKPIKCDLRLAPGKQHKGLFKFWLSDVDFIFVCAECLKVLVRQEWLKQHS